MGGGELKDSAIWLRFYKQNTLWGHVFRGRTSTSKSSVTEVAAYFWVLSITIFAVYLQGVKWFSFMEQPLLPPNPRPQPLLTGVGIVMCFTLFSSFPFLISTKIINPSLLKDFTEHMFRFCIHALIPVFKLNDNHIVSIPPHQSYTRKQHLKADTR